MPVHNSECWLDECLKSVWEQDFKETMELSIFNDASKVCFSPYLKYCPINAVSDRNLCFGLCLVHHTS